MSVIVVGAVVGWGLLLGLLDRRQGIQDKTILWLSTQKTLGSHLT